jgi:dTDP-L-rhamnose 4-epimerase
VTEEANLACPAAFITGGAGFIGSRLTRALAARGSEVTVFDSLHPQVHGPSPVIDLPARLVRGDVRDSSALARALADARPEVVIHLAAETGTGQSADEPARYVDVNVGGTARLIEAMKALPSPPERLVLAATRAVYGEGLYARPDGSVLVPEPRRTADMAAGIFDVRDADGTVLAPLPTPEAAPPRPGSVYGSSKLMQEYLLTQVPAPWRSVALRLQNVYGPGQALRNPYTGVLSIFCQQAMAGQVLNIYEDGNIVRDFVFVDDVVDAFVAACTSGAVLDRAINVGTGRQITILDAAKTILRHLGRDEGGYRISGDFRPGDVRHAVADVVQAQALIGEARIGFEDGAKRLVEWAAASASMTAAPLNRRI